MNIAIIGLGLIGGSLGRAIVSKTEHKVFAYDCDESALLKGSLLNAYHDRLTDDNVSDMDMAVFALCPTAAVAMMKDICPRLKKGAIVTDCCGNKRLVTDAMKELGAKYPEIRFVGAHPMAGREFSGISHSSASLFERAYVVIVPVTEDLDAMAAVKRLYKDIGAQDVEICTAEKHDEMIAYTSQLAHIASSSYIKNERSVQHAGFSAGSFRDMTRVAKLNPEMWTELFLQNADYLSENLADYIMRLSQFKLAIDKGDADKLRELLQEGVRMKEAAENARKERLKND